MAEPERQIEQPADGVSRRRGRPAGGTTSSRNASTPRRRLGGAELVETLDEMVSQLIKENRSLKRQLARLTAGSPAAIGGAAERTLRSLQRKVERAVAPAPAPRRRRSSTTSASPRARTPRRRGATE